MAGNKRTRRANGDKDAKGRSKRRKNGTGTLERYGDKWVAKFYIDENGLRRRKARTVSVDLVRQAREKRGLPTEGICDPISIEDARLVLADLSECGGQITREMILARTQLELQGMKAEREAVQRERAEAERQRIESETDARAVKIADGWNIYAVSKKRPDSGSRTLAGYEAQYKTFAKWCADNIPDKPKMRDFTPEDAEAFIDHIEKSRSRNTRNKYLVFLRGFWRVLRWNADAQLTVDPWEGVRTLTATPDKVTRRDITVEELGRVAAYLRTDEAKDALAYTYQPTDGRRNAEAWDLRFEMLSLVALGVYLGARLGDCVTLDWGSVDLVLNTITFMPRKTARKYKREVTAPIHPALGRLLESVPAEKRRGYLLPMLAEIYLNRESSLITNRFQAVLRAVGIETSAPASKGEGGGTRARVAVGFHSLRHFFAAWLDNHGVNHSITNYLTCHDQGKVEANYYHGNREALALAVATLPTIPMLTDADAPTTDEGKAGAQQILSRLDAFKSAWNALTPGERLQAVAYIRQGMA